MYVSTTQYTVKKISEKNNRIFLRTLLNYLIWHSFKINTLFILLSTLHIGGDGI